MSLFFPLAMPVLLLDSMNVKTEMKELLLGRVQNFIFPEEREGVLLDQAQLKYSVSVNFLCYLLSVQFLDIFILLYVLSLRVFLNRY